MSTESQLGFIKRSEHKGCGAGEDDLRMRELAEEELISVLWEAIQCLSGILIPIRCIR